MSLTHKFKDEFLHLEFTAESGRRFDAKTVTQGDIDRMDARQKAEYLEPVKTEPKPIKS